jgi:hypothetical protein
MGGWVGPITGMNSVVKKLFFLPEIKAQIFIQLIA